MKKQGFTLAELLGVLIILGVITAITFPVVTNQVEKYKNKLCVTQYENILNAARAYGADHLVELNDDNTITLGDLVSGGYIEKDIKDSANKQIISEALEIKIIKSGKKYKYYIVDNGQIGCVDNFDGLYTGSEEDTTICKNTGTTGFTPGTKYICNPGDGVERTFYVLTTSTNKVNLIMNGDLNISSTLADAPTLLANQTAEWIDVDVRLPMGNEIASRDASCTNWTASGVYGNVSCSSLPSWLLENANGTFYLTSSTGNYADTPGTWVVNTNGSLVVVPNNNTAIIRPVITVSKDKIS